MTKSSTNPLSFIFFMLLFCGGFAIAQTAVGSGSYTTVYPGADAAAERYTKLFSFSILKSVRLLS